MIPILLDVDRFLMKNNVGEVKTTRMPDKKGYDPDGLWSEQIFGQVGSKDRKHRFGYINLGRKLIHPLMYDTLKTVSEITSKIINQKEKYSLTPKGDLVVDANGQTGVAFLISILDTIDLRKIAKKEKAKEADYIMNKKRFILVDKWPVIPAFLRDIDITQKTGRIKSEINTYYMNLIRNAQTPLTGDPEDDSFYTGLLQSSLLQIATWIKDNLKGKHGVLRGSMLKKTMDFSSRLILISSAEVPLGQLGLPWSTLLMIYEPLITYHIFHKDQTAKGLIQQHLKKETFNVNDMQGFVDFVNKNPQTVKGELRQELIKAITEVIKGGTVLCKRDPVVHRGSWFAAEPIITEGQTATVNSLDLGPINGDSDKTHCPIIW